VLRILELWQMQTISVGWELKHDWDA